MANVSDWSANERENLFLDDMNLSDERGGRAAKIMAAVKAKEDEQDARLDAVAGGLVFRGTKADYAALEAVSDPAVGDMYSVTALGGENYAWNGTAWDSLGTSDANVVHKTGNETVAGEKSFTSVVKCVRSGAGAYAFQAYAANPYVGTGFDGKQHNFSGLELFDVNSKHFLAVVSLTTAEHSTETGLKYYSVFDNSTPLSGRLLFREVASGEGSDVSLCVLPDLVPDASEAYSLGRASNLWSEVFSQTAAINTSDERRKTSIAAIPDDVLDAWGDVDFRQYQLASSVAVKGESARIHAGCIAQQIASVFASRGLDAARYGLFCHDEWQALPEVADEDGTVLHEAVPAGDMYSLRYEEALCVEAAYQRRRADRLEARIAALEARLNGND